MKKFPVLVVSTACVSVLALSSCGQQSSVNSTSSPTPSVSGTAQFNSQDVEFVSMMIEHHQQAIEMSDIVLSKPNVPTQVTVLAEQIKQAQAPEIEMMRQILASWGVATPSPTQSSSGHDMDHGAGHGMMTDEQMSELENASGAQAGRVFLEQMILHHEGAVEMSEQELQQGQNPEARALAQQIIDAQVAEIAQMRQMLTELPA